ncbi:MAG: lactonase family protein [Eubacteriales bacterium]|nr:lactonase family protein [Eubacteriales bacterium]
MKYEFYLGSYAAAGEDSIYKYELDTETGILQRKNAIKGIHNPSYVLLHPNEKVLYSVEELTPEGRVAVFSRDRMLEKVFSVSSEGADPCHLALDENGEFLFVSNYTSGSLSVFRLDPDGREIVLVDHKQHKGCGKNTERQEGPHVHFSGIVDGILYVCDLGLDCLVSYKLDRETGKLSDVKKSVRLPDGFGPRHFAVNSTHPGFIYVVGELTGEVAVLKKNEGVYEIVQKISSLPAFFEGDNTAAAIKFSEDGKVLFISNRGSDSITSFIVLENGMLETGDICSSGGKGPRDFEIFDKMIVAANQYTDNLAVIKYSEDTGKMQLVSKNEEVPKPVMIQVLKRKN